MRKKAVGIALALLFLAAACLTLPFPVNAAPITIVVPDNYPTITAAVSVAASGYTVFVKKGTYEEHCLVVNKTLTLVGEDPGSTIIVNIDKPSWNGEFPPPSTVAIAIHTDNVTVSNFTITDASASIAAYGNQIQITNNIMPIGYVHMEGSRNSVANNTLETNIECIGSYNNVSANKIVGNYKGIILEGSFNTVSENSLIDGINLGGIHITGDQNTVAKNTLINCHAGITVERGSHNIVLKNKISENGGGIGVYEGHNNTFEANSISNKLASVVLGGNHLTAGNNVFYHNNFINNSEQLYNNWELLGTGNFWDNGREGNYWSNLNNADSNQDGIGDAPFVIIEKNIDNFPLMFPWGAWDLALSSPVNQSYSGGVSLVFVVDRPASWFGYSLDGRENVTVAGNTTLSGLAEGWHTVAVYANDTLGNAGTSETISFLVDTQTALFQTLLVTVTVVAVAVGAGLLLYNRKRRREAEKA